MACKAPRCDGVASETDSAGNSGSASLTFTLATAAPVVTAIADMPSQVGPLDVGKAVIFEVGLSQPVTVTGTPTLLLNDGGTANYVSDMDGDLLRFAYTVAAGQNTSDLTVTGLILNGATIGTGILGFPPIAYDFTPLDLTGVTTAELTGNGLPDVIASEPDGVDVMLNNGSGGFGPPVEYSAGPYPESVTAADLTGNGIQDLAVADYYGDVSVLMGNGSGGFGAATEYAVPGAWAVTTADVNGENKPDLLVADTSTDTASVLLNNGSGGFLSAVTYAAGPSPYSIATAHVTGTGPLDLVVADYGGGAAVLPGNASGGFGAPTFYSVGLNPDSVTTADLTGNGLSDIIVAQQYGGVVVLLNNGSGGFLPATTYAAGPTPVSVATADVNGDGTPDIIGVTTDRVSVLTNTEGLGLTSVGTAPGAATGLAIDTTPPAVTVALVVNSGNVNSTSDPEVAGAGDPNALVTLTEGITALGTTVANASGAWTFTPLLALGSNSVTATETDAAGNTGTATVEFQLVPGATAIAAVASQGGNPDAGRTITSTVAFSAPLVVTGRPELTLNDGGSAVYASGSGADALTFVYTVAAGQNTADLEVTALNNNGGSISNPASTTYLDTTSVPIAPGHNTMLVVDTTPPAMTEALVNNPGNTNIATDPALTGGGDPSAVVTLTEGIVARGTTTANAAGVWSFTPALATGAHTIVATETDAAGHQIKQPSAPPRSWRPTPAPPKVPVL